MSPQRWIASGDELPWVFRPGTGQCLLKANRGREDEQTLPYVSVMSPRILESLQKAACSFRLLLPPGPGYRRQGTARNDRAGVSCIGGLLLLPVA